MIGPSSVNIIKISVFNLFLSNILYMRKHYLIYKEKNVVAILTNITNIIALYSNNNPKRVLNLQLILKWKKKKKKNWKRLLLVWYWSMVFQFWVVKQVITKTRLRNDVSTSCKIIAINTGCFPDIIIIKRKIRIKTTYGERWAPFLCSV